MPRSYVENRDISVHTDKRLVTAYPCYQIEIFTLEFVWTTTRDCSGDTRTPGNLQFIVLIFESEYNRKVGNGEYETEEQLSKPGN